MEFVRVISESGHIHSYQMVNGARFLCSLCHMCATLSPSPLLKPLDPAIPALLEQLLPPDDSKKEIAILAALKRHLKSWMSQDILYKSLKTNTPSFAKFGEKSAAVRFMLAIGWSINGEDEEKLRLDKDIDPEVLDLLCMRLHFALKLDQDGVDKVEHGNLTIMRHFKIPCTKTSQNCVPYIKEILDSPHLADFLAFDLLPNASLKSLKDAYLKLDVDNVSRQKYIGHLTNIATLSKFKAMEEFIVTEVSKYSLSIPPPQNTSPASDSTDQQNPFAPQQQQQQHKFPPKTIQAFGILNLAPTHNAYEIIQQYQSLVLKYKQGEQQYLKALHEIQQNFDSESQESMQLELFLGAGVVPDPPENSDDAATLVIDDESGNGGSGGKEGAGGEGVPVGLCNIGNTCYLNSLLQYYFSLRPLRDLILFSGDAGDEGDKMDLEDGKNRNEENMNVNGNERRSVEREAVAKEFIIQLQKLFSEMIYSRKKAITPSKKLAEIALNGYINKQVGEQQDIIECMDNIVELIEIGIPKSKDYESGKELLNRLFYGKTKQRIQEPDNDEKVTYKEEPFNHLIVNVTKDLYFGLDEFFEESKVEFKSSHALRSLSLLHPLPKILTIQIQRVKYDRELKLTFKSNEFCKFEKEIYLDVFMDGVSVEERKVFRKEREERGRMEQRVLEEIKEDEEKLEQFRLAVNEVMTQEATPEQQDTVETLVSVIQSLESRIKAQTEKLAHLRTTPPSKTKYTLHAVFIHEGQADFGHYWSFMYDRQTKRWLKYNDSIVTEVPESVVFEDTTGSSANAYCLMYCDDSEYTEIANTVARTTEIRDEYTTQIPNLETLARDNEKTVKVEKAEKILKEGKEFDKIIKEINGDCAKDGGSGDVMEIDMAD
ncbi:ubiquitin-specific protease ubp2 [Nowakowskiella sp. JEL0407]|nr:ubiquitin-specific protease ubp2 [Nowakowskiella sp. JEL0407]